METLSIVPSRNPLSYCRLCLSQVNLLTTLQASDLKISPHKELLQKLYHYAKVSLNPTEDFPSAICGVCTSQLNEFHEFRRIIVRNHNAVKSFRRIFGDDTVPPQSDEQQEILVDVIDDSQLVKIKEEELSPESSDDVKEVDVYHMDGELRTVVVKQERMSPERSLPVAENKSKNETTNKIAVKPLGITPQVNILNKKAPVVAPKRPPVNLLNMNHQEKRIKTPIGASAFSVVKCTQCSAVFRSRENLIIHEKNDHRIVKPALTTIRPGKVANKLAPLVEPVKPALAAKPNQMQHVTLFKCAQCNSSFIQKINFQEHLKTCKVAVLAKLNPSQITIKRTRNDGGKSFSTTVATKPSYSRNNCDDSDRLRCSHCPLMYKTKHFLQKHLFDVHKIVNDEEVFCCSICKLNYSCSEDLQLHNRAIHRFQCMHCSGDFRNCMHAQSSVKVENENIVNKVEPE